MPTEPLATPYFSLNIPEKLSGPLLLENDEPHTMNQDGGYFIDPDDIVSLEGWRPVHYCLWDTGDQPVATGDADVYTVHVVVTAKEDNTDINNATIRFCRTTYRVTVRQPKTAGARIWSAVPIANSNIVGDPISGPGGTLNGIAFEPTVAADGRLMVARFFSKNMTWKHGQGLPDQTSPQLVDIVYSWSEVLNSNADPSNWTDFRPISVAPYDTRINTSLGFALEPFRGADGQPIIQDPAILAAPDDQTYDLGATYPWVDRAGNNLFVETIDDWLYVDGDMSGTARYPSVGAIQDPTVSNVGHEDPGPHQGVSVLGKWSHGKLVQIDNLNNDLDYALHNVNGQIGPVLPQSRLVSLFSPGTQPAWWGAIDPDSWSLPLLGQLLLGYGRTTNLMPEGENDNGNIIDSLENKLNYREGVKPVAFRDVTWHVNNCKQTDELIFDDMLDPDAFIVSNMVGLIERIPPPLFTNGTTNQMARFLHHTGWDENADAFTGSIRVQNSATALSTHMAVPAYGQGIGGTGRIEPAAAGGVRGKGLWLDGANGVEYHVPIQPAGVNLNSRDWYVGLFLDSREPNPGTSDVRLITWPDGSQLRLVNRQQFEFVTATGTTAHLATKPAPLGGSDMLDDLIPDRGWCHVGLQIRDQGREVELCLNGLPFSRWSSNGEPLFQMMELGNITLGANGNGDGFRGWVDEFKVLAHSVDLETACNHAGGTLIGLDSTYNGIWRTAFANRFPGWVHSRISEQLRSVGEAQHDAYACFYDYRQDYGVSPVSVQALVDQGGVTHLRSGIHFPEGPLFRDRPRPDSVSNKFCISCHHTGGQPGLGLPALQKIIGLNAPQDGRRQPNDPPPLIFGKIPAGLVDSTGLPTSPLDTGPGGQSIDEYRWPDFPGAAASVQSITLIDSVAGEDLLDMPFSTALTGPVPGAPALDPLVLGTANIGFRVNLDHGQGTVDYAVAATGNPSGTFDAPYELSFDLTWLNLVGSNEVTFTPENGVPVLTSFTLVDVLSANVVADYQADFQAGSPPEGWLYGWNANGPVDLADSFQSLNWFDGPNPGYTIDGLSYPTPGTPMPWGRLTSTGGHPGIASSPDERFVMVGYKVRFNGTYQLQGNVVTQHPSPTGLEVMTMIQSPAFNQMAALPVTGTGTIPIPSAPIPLVAGDIIWVAVGPDGNGNADGFQLNLSILGQL